MPPKKFKMKNLVYIISVFLLLVSCTKDNKKEKTSALKKENTKTIEYGFNDRIETNGTYGIAYYVDSKLSTCTTSIYGTKEEMKIIYFFKDDHINVDQENLTDLVEGDSINHHKWTSEKFSYTLDLNGLLINSDGSEEKIYDIFQEVKNAVPFELK